MSHEFILIPGRTSRQGSGISEGKFGETYMSEIQTLMMCSDDMSMVGLVDGDSVELASDHGKIKVSVATSKGDELTSGILFIAYGDLSSRLMGSDTHGSGMPTSKCIDVRLTRTSN